MSASFEFLTQDAPEVRLDGLPVVLPKSRRSLNAIRSYLERLALEQQRIVHSFRVDGKTPNSDQPQTSLGRIQLVEAETICLEQTPLHLICTAREQAAQARTRLEAAVVLALINEGKVASELWWKLATELKAPLLTLSLLPEWACGSSRSSASLIQLRKWQMQQLAEIMKDVDEACWADESNVLSSVLENRAIPWLTQLEESMDLWHATLSAGFSVDDQRVATA